jgi:hypothetical protein
MPSQLAGRKGGIGQVARPVRAAFAPPVKMIMPRYGKRPWEPEEDDQLREMVEAGKTITIISLRLKRTVTAVRGRLGILKVSLGKVGRRPKERKTRRA